MTNHTEKTLTVEERDGVAWKPVALDAIYSAREIIRQAMDGAYYGWTPVQAETFRTTAQDVLEALRPAEVSRHVGTGDWWRPFVRGVVEELEHDLSRVEFTAVENAWSTLNWLLSAERRP